MQMMEKFEIKTPQEFQAQVSREEFVNIVEQLEAEKIFTPRARRLLGPDEILNLSDQDFQEYMDALGLSHSIKTKEDFALVDPQDYLDFAREMEESGALETPPPESNEQDWEGIVDKGIIRHWAVEPDYEFKVFIQDAIQKNNLLSLTKGDIEAYVKENLNRIRAPYSGFISGAARFMAASP